MSDQTSTSRLVFVSHSGDDTWVARKIASCAQSQGARTFLDEADVQIGAEFEDDVLTHLERADELIVLMTPWALSRPYVWAEIGAAWLRRIPIIVVLHGLTPKAFQELPNAPIFLKKRDIIVLNDIDLYFAQLRLRVTTSLPGASHGHA